MVEVAVDDAAAASEVMAEFSRIYMVPGMLHCVGGPGAWVADYISPMVDWVENDKAPDQIIGTQTGVINWFEALALRQSTEVNWTEAVTQAGEAKEGVRRFSRPICPYPQFAKYTGSGDVDRAESFVCTETSSDAG